MILTTLRIAMRDHWAFIGVRRRVSFSYKRIEGNDVILDETLFALKSHFIFL